MTHATPFDNPNTVETHPPADRLIESMSVDRTMTRNSGNPDAVAEVPDSVIARQRAEEREVNRRYYAEHPGV